MIIAGNADVIGFYDVAKTAWSRLFNDRSQASLQEWAGWLSNNQIRLFEEECGGRWMGQEVMGWSGFAMLYTTEDGFGSRLPIARKLLAAFSASSCSIEVKSIAERAAEFYDINE
jgi:hypothetical protein